MGLRTTVRAGDTVDETPRHRFENAWRLGTPIALEPCLEGLAGERRAALLEELLTVELEHGWRIARGQTIEAYLARFPELAADPARLKRLVMQELRVRYRFADRPAIATYAQRFPGLIGPADEVLLHELAESAAAGTLGRYRIESELGHGGFGRVWQARDPVLGRVVAVKQLHPHVARRAETRQRFVGEARVAARLEHPGVVPVYELGDGPDGPFFAMKLVRGETLADAIVRVHAKKPGGEVEDAGAIARARLVEAFLTVARTMAFAHARGFIHRDLKPQNVVLGDYGETVILDWGIAKSLDEVEIGPDADDPAVDSTLFTRDGSVMGTPAYMAPEQARGEVARLDRRSDVFALGAMLYEVLTGHLPFPRPTSDEMIAEVASPRPVAVRPRQLIGQLPRALEAICLKALAKDPGARYPDAGALAADLERHLAGAPVSAHVETLIERVARWARHHRGLVLTGGAALLVLTLGAVMAAVMIEGERSQARDAEAQAVAAQAVAASERRLAEASREDAEGHLYVASLALAERAWRDWDLAAAERQLEATPPARRGWEWDYLMGLARGATSERAGSTSRLAAGPGPGGELLAAASPDGELRVWERRAGAPLATVSAGGSVEALVVLWGGRVAALVHGAVRAFDARGQPVTALETDELVLALARSADGKRLIRVEAPNRVVTVDVETGAKVAEARAATRDASAATGPLAPGDEGPPVAAIAVAPDASVAVTVDLELGLRATDLATSALLWTTRLAAATPPTLAYGAVVVAGQDRRYGGRVTRLDPKTGAVLEPVTDFERPVTALAADPERDRFVVGTLDGALHVVDAGVEVNVLRAHRAAVRDLVLVGGELVSGGADGVRAWDPERPQGRVSSSGYALAFARDGSWVDGSAAVHERWTGALRGAPPELGLDGLADKVLFAGARDEAVVLVVDGVGHLVGRRGGGARAELGPVDAVAVSRDGTRLGVLGGGRLATWVVADRRAAGEVVLWKDAGPWWSAVFPRGDGWLAVSQDGRALTARDEAGRVLWSVPSAAGGAAPTRDGVIAASADGALLAVLEGAEVRLHTAVDGAVVGALEMSAAGATALAFLPDGRRLAVADDAHLGLWDVARGREVFELGLEDRAARVATSADGRSIGVALEDGRVCIFNAAWPRGAIAE